MIAQVNSEVWTYKKSRGIRFSQPIEGATLLVPEGLSGMKDELMDLHNTTVATYSSKPPEGAEAIGGLVFLLRTGST